MPRTPPTHRCGSAASILGIALLSSLPFVMGACASTPHSPIGAATGPQAAGPATTLAALGPSTVVAGRQATVEAVDDDFTPKNLVVKPATAVTFTNSGRAHHDVVFNDQADSAFDINQGALSPGGSVTRTFTKPGTYFYYCSIHATPTAGEMRGEIVVK